MTIDEVIGYEKKCSKRSDAFVGYTTEEHKQLAEWLEELKFIRQWKADIMESFCKYDASSFEEIVHNTRNKAIDEFLDNIYDVSYFVRKSSLISGGYSVATLENIEVIAEQMKTE